MDLKIKNTQAFKKVLKELIINTVIKDKELLFIYRQKYFFL